MGHYSQKAIFQHLPGHLAQSVSWMNELQTIIWYWEEWKGIRESGWAEAEAHTLEISPLAGLVD